MRKITDAQRRGKRLRAWLGEKGLTVERFAASVQQLSVSTFYKLCRGDIRRLRKPTQECILRAFPDCEPVREWPTTRTGH